MQFHFSFAYHLAVEFQQFDLLFCDNNEKNNFIQ